MTRTAGLRLSWVRTWVGLLAALVLTVCTAQSQSGAGTELAGSTAPGSPPAGPRIRQYNVLGKTGLKVSDIGFGTANTADPELVEYALDLGINYFDTAEGYGRGSSESAIGIVAAKRRAEMVICTKLEIDARTTIEDILTRAEACLGRLQTGYIDILMIHGGSSQAVSNPAVYAAFDTLKARGKIHFCGLSHHGPNISGELAPLIEAGKIDVILCSYDPQGDPGIPAMLERARQKGIGLVAMKVLPSARQVNLPEFTSGSYPFHLAAMRWALRESGMHSILVTFSMMDQMDEFVTVSGAARG